MGCVINATPRPLYPRERPGNHCTGDCVGPRAGNHWVDPRAGLDGCGKSRPQRNSIPGPSTLYRAAIPTELSRPSPHFVTGNQNTAFCQKDRVRFEKKTTATTNIGTVSRTLRGLRQPYLHHKCMVTSVFVYVHS
jgi:hypothetical protein